MKDPHKLYIDCSAGISGDMLLAGLNEIANKAGVEVKAPKLAKGRVDHEHHDDDHEHHEGDHEHYDSHDDHDAHHSHHHDHGRSYSRVKDMISNADAGETAKTIALNIYAAIAKAEAQVHEKTLETVHFHEVGRDQAIENALGIGAALEALGASLGEDNVANQADRLEILVSTIYDGTGFIDCAHGRIPVPVPAVQAMKKQCPEYRFETAEEVKTEMVTPSGLAALIGIGAKATDGVWNPSEEYIAFAEVRGSRDTGRGGLKLYLAE